MKIVVIGAVAAGPKTACRAKRLLPDAEIIMIDQDDLISYGGCGIPYYVSGDIQDEKELRSTRFHMVRDERFFENAKGIKTLTLTKALSIDRHRKHVLVEHVRTGEKKEIPYDKLVIATGSRPNIPPIPGVDLEGVFTISSLHKAISIKEKLARGEVGKAVIIGGGAIGLEMAEALTDLWGIDTTVIEFMPQILPNMVPLYMARMLQTHLEENHVKIYTGEDVKEIRGDGKGYVRKVVTAKRELDADLIIVATGVRPRGELAREAGLLCSSYGAICVNKRMQTSDPDIYAAGDCVETLNLVTGKKAYAPFGSLANRQGRVVADNLAGIPSTFDGVLGSFIMKAFDVSIGAIGLSLDVARKEGFEALEAIAVQSDRAHFFPTRSPIFLSIVVDTATRRILGLQGIGKMGDGVLARINAACGLIGRQALISDFSTLELAYAPPFSNAIDVLNAVANIADNLVAGRLKVVSIEEFMDWMNGDIEHPDWLVVDVRHPRDATPWAERFKERWLAISYDMVRSHMDEIPHDKTLVVVCDTGVRAYEAQLVLESGGYEDVRILPGGLSIIKRLKPDWWVL